MPGTKVRVQKATTLLHRDHEILDGLFSLYDKLGDEAESARKLRLFNELRFKLNGHATVENELFYPAIERAGRRAEDAVLDALEEHQGIRTLVEELDDLDPDEPLFDVKMRQLRKAVADHSREEEQLLFPLFDRLDREVRDEVSWALKERLEEIEGSQPD